MTGTNAELQHHRRITLFRKFESVFHHLNDLRQIWTRIEKPDLRFHGKGMTPFLDDAGSFTIIFSQNDQSTAFDSRGCQV